MDKPDRDRLDAAEIERALAGGLIGKRVVVLPSTTSTNDVVWEMAQAGAPEGLIVFTEEQTAGRGQRGNRWECGRRKRSLVFIFVTAGSRARGLSSPNELDSAKDGSRRLRITFLFQQ